MKWRLTLARATLEDVPLNAVSDQGRWRAGTDELLQHCSSILIADY